MKQPPWILVLMLLSSFMVTVGWAQGSRVPLVVAPLDHELHLLNGLDGPVRTVIRSGGEWKRFWTAQALPIYVEPPADLDFDKEMVIIAAADVAPWNVIGTRIDSVWLKQDTVIVQIDLYTNESCSMPTVMSPLDAIRVRPSRLAVRFVEPTAPRGC